jgi:hypothetical protein
VIQMESGPGVSMNKIHLSLLISVYTNTNR